MIENPQQTSSFFQRTLKRCPLTSSKTRCYLSGILALIIVATIGAVYYHWQQPEVMPVPINENIAQAIPTPRAAQPRTIPNNQDLLAQQLQKATTTSVLAAESNSILPGLNNQIAIIQLLLANQQFPAALNLLNAMENDAVLLPTYVQASLQSAIEIDRENIQKAQAVVGQLTGQLQQLEHYLNQQLLQQLARQNNIPLPEITSNNTATVEPTIMEKVWDKIKSLFSKAINVQHKAAENNINEPNFYTAIMLQMALQRAQFALEQGNWAEYQLTLTSLQTWVTTDLLTWLPDAPGMIQTITELTQQPSPFANANVNNTQQALNTLMQEQHP